MSLRAFLIGVILFVTPFGFAHAAIIPQCPEAGCRLCDLVTLANNLISFVIEMSVIVAVLAIVIVGFKSVVGGESGAGELQSVLTSIVIGIVIMLSGWLVIDTILKVLTGSRIGPWHEIECVNTPAITQPHVITSPGVIAVQNGIASGIAGSQCASGNTACSVDALQGLGFTPAQANVMSCIAMSESSGNPNAVNPTSKACGTFQTVQGHWQNPASLRNATGCTASSCHDARCNALVAQSLMTGRVNRGQSAYGDWTCRGCNAKAQACVDKYDPGK